MTVKRESDTELFICIEDGGNGIHKMNQQEEHGFGFELVESLVANYDGSISIDEEFNRIAIKLNCGNKKVVEHIGVEG